MRELMLESFEVDDSNKFAVALCKAVVGLEKGYSPLLIHGERGSGKTHLLTAVSTELTLHHPEISLLFLSDDLPIEKLFFSESDSSNGGSEESIFKEYSRKDFLIVDDIERFTENPKIREKFSALFDTFVDDGKQVLFASSGPIQDLRGFDKRFLSRLSGGVDAAVHPPQPQTRLKILKRECARLGLEIDVSILQMLMREAGKDSLYLKNLPGHLKTFASLSRQPLTKDNVEEFLSVIREQLGEGRGAAAREEIVGAWIGFQAKKREGDYNAAIRDFEQKLSEQVNEANELKHELEAARARERETAAEISSLKARLREDSRRPDEKGGASADELRLAVSKTEELRAELEQLKKDKEDELLALRIQIEDKEETLKLFKEERELGLAEQDREKLDLQEQAEEARSEKILLEKAIEDLSARVRELEQDLARKDEELANTSVRQKTSRKQRDAYERELQEIRSRMKAEAEDSAEAIREIAEREQKAIAALEEKEDELISMRADLQVQVDSASAKLKRREKEALEVTSKLEAEIKRRKDLEHECAYLTSSLERLREGDHKEQEELQTALSEKDQMLSKASEFQGLLQAEIDNLSQELEAEREKVFLTEQRTQELSSHKTTVESDLDKLRADFKESTDKVQTLTEQVEYVNLERDELKGEVSSLTTDISNLRSLIEERDQLISGKSSEIENLNARISALQEKLSEQEQLLLAKEQDESEQIGRLKSELKKRGEELKGLEAQLVDREAAARRSSEQIQALDTELSGLSAGLSQLREEKEEAERRLAAALDKSGAQLSESNEHLDKLRAELEGAEARASQLAGQLEETKAAFASQMEEQASEWAEQESTLAGTNASLEARLQETASEKEALAMQVSDLEERIKGQQKLLKTKDKADSERIRRLEETLNNRSGEIEKLSAELGKRNRKIESNAEEMAKLRERLSVLEADLASITMEKEEAEQRFDELAEESQGKLKAGETRLTELRAMLEEVQTREANVSSQLQAERASAAETLERERSQSTQKERKLLEAKTSLETELSQASARILDLEEKTANAEKQLEEREQLANTAAEETSRLNRLVEEKEQRIAELQKTVASMREDFLKKYAEGSEVRERFAGLEAELSSKEKTLASIRQDYSELQSDFDNVQSEAKKAAKQAAKLESDRKKAEEEASSRTEQIKDLKKKVSELQSQKDFLETNSLTRINELERLILEKDERLAMAEARAKGELQSAITSGEEEIKRLNSAHEKTANSLKEQVKDAMRELVRIREVFEDQLRQQRDEAEDLRTRLGRAEAEVQRLRSQAAAGAAPKQEAEETVGIEFDEEPIAQPREEPVASPEPAEVSSISYVRESPIEWLHDFESFTTSEANAFSVNMAEKIARNLGELYNPLCVYGPKSAGKTHILHAIGKLAMSRQPRLPTEFGALPELLQILKTDNAKADLWKNALQLLIIDDFDVSNVSIDDQQLLNGFLRGLSQRSAQIVIASNEPPIKMGQLQEYLLDFIETGLLAKLEVHPEVLRRQKEAAEALAVSGRGWTTGSREKQRAADTQPSQPPPPTEPPQRDIVELLLYPDPALTIINFKGNHVFEEFEEAFRNPAKKWRSKFPLLVVEDDPRRRNHFFHALANRLQGIFTGPVSLLSVERLARVLAQNPAFNWSGLLNRLIKSHVILIDDCESIVKFSATTAGYLRAIIEEVLGRDILLMIGASKKYRREPVFGNVHKKASKRKL